MQDPLDGILDHPELVAIELVKDIPAASARRVGNIKAFSRSREGGLAQSAASTSLLSKQRASYEQSVWELASVLFDAVDARSGHATERLRRENVAKFWATLVQDTSP